MALSQSSVFRAWSTRTASFWRDDEAVKAWRNTEEHRQAQKTGRDGIFAGYRLRIAHVVRDYGLTERDEAPADSRAVNG